MALSNYAIGGIVMLFIGIALLITGVVLLAIDQSNQSVSEWWVWALIVIGVVALLVGIALFFIPKPKTKKQVKSACDNLQCRKVKSPCPGVALRTKRGCPTQSPSNFVECVQGCGQRFPTLLPQLSGTMSPTVGLDFPPSTPVPPMVPGGRANTDILPLPPVPPRGRPPPPSMRKTVRRQAKFLSPPETYESCKRKCESNFYPSRRKVSQFSQTAPIPTRGRVSSSVRIPASSTRGKVSSSVRIPAPPTRERVSSSVRIPASSTRGKVSSSVRIPAPPTRERVRRRPRTPPSSDELSKNIDSITGDESVTNSILSVVNDWLGFGF